MQAGTQPCPACACASPEGDAAHRINAALRDDDLDRAIDLGLLDDIACSTCAPACREALAHARDDRRRALAARERHRDRALRLARLQRERDAKRAPVQAPTGAPALPPAAAAALERAKARAAQRKPE
ncbi:hypothetical protein LK996_11245 [Lysobacter sp. A6]|uniref:Ferredoxin n=1 Tax=Noviluteimonas lactosilytica TaxID=2888523 RepID=A0ABS8JJ74_9GAMM|nr:hypothetical protein [Lysobacter lactosilyticus]MCC8363644.1 hypothetical protein [Lysobacter lactosilyticus]